MLPRPVKLDSTHFDIHHPMSWAGSELPRVGWPCLVSPHCLMGQMVAVLRGGAWPLPTIGACTAVIDAGVAISDSFGDVRCEKLARR